MHRRLACLAVALLVSGCSFSGFGPPPNYDYVVITAGGVGLRSGSADVPPNLDLRLHATGAPLQASDVTGDARREPADPRHPEPGPARDRQAVAALARRTTCRSRWRASAPRTSTFTVIAPTAAMVAAHIDPSSGLVVDAVFDDAPDQTAIAAALPGRDRDLESTGRTRG